MGCCFYYIMYVIGFICFIPIFDKKVLDVLIRVKRSGSVWMGAILRVVDLLFRGLKYAFYGALKMKLWSLAALISRCVP